MAPNSSTSIRFSDEEEEILENLRKKSNAKSKSHAVRRSVAQASFLQRHADEDGYVTLQLEDGSLVKFPVRQ